MLRVVHSTRVILAGAILLGVTALFACGDDDTTGGASTSGGGGSSSGARDAGRDAKEFIDEDVFVPPDPEGRKPTDPLRVFVTSSTFTGGDLDGTSGADTKCNEAAKDLKPKGKFVAWLSTTNAATVKERVTDPAGTLPFQLLDGTSIAKKPADLLTDPGFPLHAIDQSETKTKVTGHAWTGTKLKGENSVPACLAWSNKDADHKGGTGDVAAKDATWTELPAQDTCDTKNHLYCFEVP